MLSMSLSIIHYIATYALYGLSIIASFLFTGFMIRPLSLRELEDDEEEEKKAKKKNRRRKFRV